MAFSLETEHPIFYLAHTGKLQEIKKLILEDKTRVSMKASNGSALILFAAEGGHIELVKFLLENGANLQAKMTDDTSALLLAAHYGHLEFIKWLILSKKISPIQKDNGGCTALLIAGSCGHLPVVKWLIEEKKSKLTERCKEGCTVLMLAAARGHLDTVKWLVENQKVSLDEKTNKGTTALLLAAVHGRFDTVQWLVDKQKPSREQMEETLCFSIDSGDFNLIQWLINKMQFDVNEADVNQAPKLLRCAINSSRPHIIIPKLLTTYKFSYQSLLYLQEQSVINPALRNLVDEHCPWIHSLSQPEEGMLCPITSRIMTTPVIGPDGQTYEKVAIEAWLKLRAVSPMTRQKMKPNELYRNIFAEDIIHNFLLKASEECEKTRRSFNHLSSVSHFFQSKPQQLIKITNEEVFISEDAEHLKQMNVG